MSTDTHFEPPKKKPNVLWWLGGGFVLLVLLFFLQLFAFRPAIVVSRQTTYITAPLGPDGLPDYKQFVLEQSRKGVTPQNNAAVLMWPALWPGELDPQHYAAVAEELGLESIPSASEALDRLYSPANRAAVATWLQKSGRKPNDARGGDLAAGAAAADDALIDTVLAQAMDRPWTSDQLPPLAKWATANKGPLDQLVEASLRPRCYFPSPSLITPRHGSLVEMWLPGVQGVRDAGRALAARAMWHVGEGRIDEAWRDLLAVRRIGRLTAQCPTLVDQLVGIAIDGIANDATLALLDQSSFTREQAREIRRDMAAQRSHAGMAPSLDSMERLSYLDAIIQFGSRQDRQLLDTFGVGQQAAYIRALSIDWNVALRKGNEFFDRYVAAARLSNGVKRRQVLKQIYADLDAMADESQRPAALVGAALSLQKRSDVAAGVALNLFLPALEAAVRAQDRANTMLELTRLAAALAVYRAEHGEYPDELDRLVPVVLDKLPVDLYHGKPFVYRRMDDGYLLYSAGENGVDDDGSNETLRILQGRSLDDMDPAEADKLGSQTPAGADDYSVRLPTPRWHMPGSATDNGR